MYNRMYYLVENISGYFFLAFAHFRFLGGSPPCRTGNLTGNDDSNDM